MPALLAPALVAAALLVVTGALKVLDPSMTVGALRALGVPAAASVVRVGAAAELLLGVAALVWGGTWLWGLVALSYLGFTVVVVAALRRGTMIGSCGCFGREDTPPHWSHVALNLLLAAVAIALAAADQRGMLDAVGAHLPSSVVVVALAAIALYLLHAAYVELPKVLTPALRRTPRST